MSSFKAIHLLVFWRNLRRPRHLLRHARARVRTPDYIKSTVTVPSPSVPSPTSPVREIRAGQAGHVFKHEHHIRHPIARIADAAVL